MKSIEESKLSMELLVKHYLEENTAKTATLPGFLLVYEPFVRNLDLIGIFQMKLTASVKGWAKKKAELRDDLTTKTLDVSRKIEVYAGMTGNTMLAEEVHFSEWELKRLPDTVMKDKAAMVHNRGEMNLTALATYEVTAGELTALQTAITLFFASIDTPRHGITEKKAAYDEVKRLLKENDKLLEKLDLLMRQFKEK